MRHVIDNLKGMKRDKQRVFEEEMEGMNDAIILLYDDVREVDPFMSTYDIYKLRFDRRRANKELADMEAEESGSSVDNNARHKNRRESAEGPREERNSKRNSRTTFRNSRKRHTC
jgi:hypothetical protein